MWREQKSVKVIFLLFLIILLFQINSKGGTLFDGDKEVDWERFYNLVENNKLPLLSEEKEKEILDEVNRLLNEERSIFSAILYIMGEVSDKGKYRYCLYGNKKIKSELVRLFKMRIQYALKKSLISEYPLEEEDIKKMENLDDKKKEEGLKRLREEKRSMETLLKHLISIDGDLCPEPYMNDTKGDELFIPESPEDEVEYPYYMLEAFCSIVFSTFPDDIYDYLWKWEIGYSINFPTYITPVLIAKKYPQQFLQDASTGYKGYYDRVYRKNGGYIILHEKYFYKIIHGIIDYNPEFTKENKKEIKSVVRKYYIPQGIYSHESTLRVYEKIGEKEDIEFIKELGEKIDYTYQVREVTEKEKVSAKEKEKVLNQVKQFKDRVNALVEKLSHQ